MKIWNEDYKYENVYMLQAANSKSLEDRKQE